MIENKEENSFETVQEGSWRPIIDSVRPLDEAESAYGQLQGDHFGKLVLVP